MSDLAPLLFGKYKLLELIARGGMAEVFKAKSYGVDGFEKLVVIKRILPDLAQNHTFVEMAINEAKLSVALSHANIVQVFDLGREEDTYFIVMEYVNGMDFAEVLRRCRRANVIPPFEICAYIASETARALDYAHRRRDSQMRPMNIVHRDISPQNVLLSFEGEVKVTDFGIAKARTTIEESGTIKGKYAYMSPEQARGSDVDARADIFALGVLLYEALAGRNPFHEPTPYETLRRVQNGSKPTLASIAPNVPDELAAIVETATHPDRAQRFQSAAKLYEALAGYLYSTGKRVASHDLSEWLETLRSRVENEDESHRVRDALEDIGPSDVKTPVEVPASASQLSRPGPSTSSGLSRPHLERRDVTLLSIELADRPDPATRPFESFMPIANRFGGIVADATEQHAVLIFGAHDPDGRDTETATRCALKLQHAAARSQVAIGIGIHAARVHVNATGSPERDQWFTAAVALVRDLGRAAGSRILASEPVGRIVGEQFQIEPVRSRTADLDRVAGTPLLVLAERSQHDGTHRRFVGRKDPLRKVGEVLARGAKSGARSVVLVGEAGTGKTRFLDEVVYRLRRMNHPVNWYATTCFAHDRDVPMSALQSMLRVILGVDETDHDEAIREKVQRLRELGCNDDEAAAVSVLLGVDAGNGADPAAHLRGACGKIATRLAQDKLTVLVWDSAEAMDDDSQMIVDELLRNAGRARVVVIVACRPGFVYAWKDAPKVEEITLGALPEDEARQLVAQRLGVPREADLPPELLEDLWTKGAGNPLFVEEYTKSLQEAGALEVREGDVIYRRDVAEVEVPKTLRGLVTSEIARLSPTQRQVLQVAACVGPRFHRDVILEVGGYNAKLLDETLQSLVTRGSLHQVASDEFAFAHDLRRDVVYEGLPLEARWQLHVTVAAVLERLYPDRLDELAERLAHHHREANERASAIEYLVRAARRQQSESAYAAATANLARAIELVLASPRSEPERVMNLYADLGMSAIRSRQVDLGLEKLRLGLAYAEDLGDRAHTIRMLVLLGRLLALGHQVNEAVQHFERARGMVPATDRTVLGEIAASIGATYERNGDFRRAHSHLEEAAKLAGQRGDRRDTASAFMALARCEAAAGERDRALSTWERANDLITERDEPSLRVDAVKTLAQIHFFTRDFQHAAEFAERTLEEAREYGLSYEAAIAAHNAGDTLIRLGDYRKAFVLLSTSQQIATDRGLEKLRQLNTTLLAFIDAAQFNKPEALGRIESAAAYAASHGYTWDLLQAKYLLGVIAKEQGNREHARALLREALALANETENKMWADDCEALLREVSSLAPPSLRPPRG